MAKIKRRSPAYRVLYVGLETPNGDLAVDIRYKGKTYGGYIPKT